ncbi:hypothetical protein [Leptolyngbya sp. FACHB-261]|uniref:hypothetical protein n=1 Tax=Leptolyngbya sp. FACHB-261 TaxID=2692806 RepID=UPI001685997C|nr:hypothetical protein [Leptolyngbya sp. FACHB-261]MBD2100272.1 hypothetical protein [Leptolyngbya sp. FACHB-261]
MAEKTVTEFFGAGFTQTNNAFTIAKADLQTKLAAAGYTYTPGATDTAEELFVALVLLGLVEFSEASRAIDPATRNVVVVHDPTFNYSIVSENSRVYSRHDIEVRLLKETSVPMMSPDTYAN